MPRPTIMTPNRIDIAPTAKLRTGDSGPEVTKLYEYLKRFGYFPNERLARLPFWRPAVPFTPKDPSRFDDRMTEAVRLFQRAQGLPIDGTLNQATLDLMARPRCGHPDIVPGSSGAGAPGEAAVENYVLQGNRWTSRNLTYHFDGYTPDLPQADTRAQMRAALDRWSAVCGLGFSETVGAADMRIGFYSGDHGCGYPFDSASGVLAHGFYPPPNGGDVAGDIHFDEAEQWSVNTPPSGIDLLTVALHEFGHTIGLGHSNVASAVMYAYYGGPRRDLTSDDVAAAQALYGARYRWASRGGVIFDHAVTSNADGRLEVFCRGSDGALWHVWQTAPNNGWSSWISLGGQIQGPIAVGRNADGRLEVGVRGTDGALWHMWQTAPNSGWSAWASLGGWIRDPVLANNADGRLEWFATGSDGALWHMWQTAPSNGWSSWASLGGGMGSRVAVARNADGRLEVFVRGTDGALWHMWQTAPNSGWSAWASLGGQIQGAPAIGRNRDGRLEVFARGTDGALWHMWQTAPNSGWSGWASLGGVVSDPQVTSDADGRLEVFVRGSDNGLWHLWQTAPNNGWSTWSTRGGTFSGPPVLGANRDGRLEVFVKGTDSALWHTWQTAPSNGWA